MKSLVIIFALALAYSAYACQPIIRVYETNEAGDQLGEVMIVVDEQNVTKRGINHTDSQVFTCTEGVWMGYQYEAYGGESALISGKPGDINNCVRDQNDGRLMKSMKAVGAPDDYFARAVVTYLNSNNQWADTTYLNDTEQLLNTRFNSLILVGEWEVQIFAESDYQGDSFCIRGTNGMIHNKEEFEERNGGQNGNELFTDLMDLNAILGRSEFHSLRFGCE